ncbi:M23 family metallopeptidase [Streptomyces yaizuensis]|uniref:M23 family metallopeptidase n=1 Tax=Streptomyces yaizuensis TaxID=2989713 RepID=A0ABQ5P2J2_9ACTN|nr:M23 family metallopeptidase [Streptomyces sp. YSPA8]GLF96805.1 M23 family metallopeptidase [Streptomyces sp. YSPA8]
MGLRHRSRLPLVAGAALCALLLTPPPVHATGGPGGTGAAGAEVARLYEQVERAVAAHERDRRAARALRVRADALQRRLDRQRRELRRVRDAVGAYARAQYRTGGPLAVTARLLGERDPESLLRGRRYAHQAETAVHGLLARARLAERRNATAEHRARAAWRRLEIRRARLAAARKDIERQLRQARELLRWESGPGSTGSDCAGALPVAGPVAAGPAGARWVAPVRGYRLSAGFGRRGAYWANRHTGQDFAVPLGTPVRAAGAGRVLSVSCGGPFGLEIVIWHPDGFSTQYAHLAAAVVVQGAEVRTGQRIGLAGTTGNSTGPHLHFEVRRTSGAGVEPVGWLRGRGVVL